MNYDTFYIFHETEEFIFAEISGLYRSKRIVYLDKTIPSKWRGIITNFPEVEADILYTEYLNREGSTESFLKAKQIYKELEKGLRKNDVVFTKKV